LIEERDQRYGRLQIRAKQRRRALATTICGKRDPLGGDPKNGRGKLYLGGRFSNYEITRDAQAKAVGTLKAYCRALPGNVANRRGLVLYGTCGTGKDHLLAAVVRRVVLVHGIKVLWTTGPRLFNAFRSEIDGSDLTSRNCRDVEVLAVSDPIPPAGQLTPFISERLFGIVDARYSDGKPTWITCNVASREDMEHAIGVQTVDRLIDNAVLIRCDWPSYRKRAK